jgi:hypothetical protein
VVTGDGYRVDYERQFDKILCNVATSSTLLAKYTWAVPESYWPGTFAEAVTQALEAVFLRGIGERFSEGEARQKDAEATLRMAKLEDSQNNATRNPVTSPTLEARGAVVLGTDPLTARWG